MRALGRAQRVPPVLGLVVGEEFVSSCPSLILFRFAWSAMACWLVAPSVEVLMRACCFANRSRLKTKEPT
jgi:hypothetical protein